VRDYANLGVDRLVLWPPPRFWADARYPLPDLDDYVRANAPELLGAER
jgi:hypothetical protein